MMFEQLVDIKRFTFVGTNGRRQLAPLYTAVTSLVLPMSAQAAVTHKFSLGRAYDIYFPAGQDVQTGDQIIYNSKKYTVEGVQPYDVPLVGHVHTLCQQDIT